MNPDEYLARIGVDPVQVTVPDYDTLARLVAAHATSVPFETLAVAGDPHGTYEGAGVSFAVEDCFEKVVRRERGGFCYELNGLFGWLLDALGYDPDRVAAMVLSDDGDPSPPANHLTHVVELDRRYVVDVGLGCPRPREPIPLDGESRTAASGVEWRVADSDRPDATHRVQRRDPDGGWTDRYVFADRHRSRSYFAATCEYLATAPESGFTDDPVVARSTATGYLKLRPDAFIEVDGTDQTEQEIDSDEWHDLLESEFEIAYPPA
jgi:N-hydroxyarylamine O-acetyltransferase